ncbi:MAG: cation:dicarboxylase symporter family transporter, partial [Myxococcota bacterium]
MKRESENPSEAAPATKKRLPLHHQILIAMVLGAGIGLPLNAASGGAVSADVVDQVATVGKGIGDLFLRLLSMLVVPLIVSSLIAGVTAMGDLKKLGGLGARAFGFYLSTSFLAIVTGILFVNLIEPGVGADRDLLEAAASTELPAVTESDSEGLGAVLWNQLESMIPKNPLKAAADGDMLPIIFFSLLLGVFISLVEHGSEDDQSKSGAALMRRFFAGLFAVMMRYDGQRHA